MAHFFPTGDVKSIVIRKSLGFTGYWLDIVTDHDAGEQRKSSVFLRFANNDKPFGDRQVIYQAPDSDPEPAPAAE